MDFERQWLVDSLRRMGQKEIADDAALELPERFSQRKLEEWASRHGIQSRDELISMMGGSP